MITYLRVVNFRRHAETELRFDNDAQLILFAGDNGNGKSTLAIEAILYALYGQGRHGKAKLDRLIRRGAELEGLEVELEFTHGDATYRIRRHRDLKVTSAILYANENPIMEGADAVSAEVTRILGMDAAAFKIAGIAQQKELEGITKLKPAERSAMLSRLLRLDAITRAKRDAKVILLTNKNALDVLGTGENIQSYQDSAQNAVVALNAAIVSEGGCDQAIVKLEKELAALSHAANFYQEATTHFETISTIAANSADEEIKLSGELAALTNQTKPPQPALNLLDLIGRAAQVERDLLTHSQLEAEIESAVSNRRELAQVNARVDEIEQSLALLDEYASNEQLASLEKEQISQLFIGTELKFEIATLHDSKVTIEVTIQTLQSQLDKLDSLDSICPTCEQDIAAEHFSGINIALGERIDGLNTHLDDVISQLTSKSAALSQNIIAERHITATMSEINNNLASYQSAKTLHSALLLSRDVFVGRDVDMPTLNGDLGQMLIRKEQLAIDISNAELAATQISERERVLIQRENLSATLNQVQCRLAAQRLAVTNYVIDPKIIANYQNLLSSTKAYEAELELRVACRLQSALCEQAVTSANTLLKQAIENNKGRTCLTNDAVVAGNASIILADCEAALNRSMRPTLEGGIAQMLSLLSEGRFTQVTVDEEYAIMVGDDAGLQPLEEFSGGELDLIALAVRLALSMVVAERSGNPLGWMILDECFGALDADRRRTVLTALRTLRSNIGQIWIISHVAGLDDECDRVVEISNELDEFGRWVARCD